MMIREIKHLLLDLDGTLVDGDTLKMRIDFIYKMIKSLRPYGRPTKTLQALHRMRSAVEGPPTDLTNEMRMIQSFANTFQMSEVEAGEILEKSVRENFPKLRKHFSPVTGATDFIEWAKKRYTLILATNPIWLPEFVGLRVSWAGLDMGDFVSFTHAKRMHSCKPRLEYYQELIAQEGLDPSLCLMVGNDYRKDLPASQVGLPVFILDRDLRSTDPSYRRLNSQSRSPSGQAPAWCGTFHGLRRFLESEG